MITVVDMEDLAVQRHVNADIQVLPMPGVTMVILRQSLALDEFPLRNAAVKNTSKAAI